MNGLYDSIGKIASAAHALGDDIDSNAFPSDSNNDRHGLDIYHRGHYLRIRAVPEEPKFTIGSPFSINTKLREQYTVRQIGERLGVDFDSMTPDEQEAAVDSVLRADLETATEYEDEVQAALQEKATPIRAAILRMTYGEEELWNGVFVRDEIFPQRESFDIIEYRDAVEAIRSDKVTVGQIISDIVPPLSDDYIEDDIESEPDSSQPDSIAFY